MNTFKQAFYVGVNRFGYAVPSYFRERRKESVDAITEFCYSSVGPKAWKQAKRDGWKVIRVVLRPICPVCQRVRNCETIATVGCCDECYA